MDIGAAVACAGDAENMEAHSSNNRNSINFMLRASKGKSKQHSLDLFEFKNLPWKDLQRNGKNPTWHRKKPTEGSSSPSKQSIFPSQISNIYTGEVRRSISDIAEITFFHPTILTSEVDLGGIQIHSNLKFCDTRCHPSKDMTFGLATNWL